MDGHAEWVRRIDAELDGELSLPERAALARHLAACAACAGARASSLELRATLARSAGVGDAQAAPAGRDRRAGPLRWLLAGLLVGAAAGWLAHARWGRPGSGSLEASRAVLVAE